MAAFETVIVSLDYDLCALVEAINSAQWDEANEMPTYGSNALRAYLERQDTVFVACYDRASNKHDALVGIASARIEIKPYGKELWLYVDELDVCADQRQRGVGTFIMRRLRSLAEEAGCEEVWLGAEADNRPANLLYRSLEPDDVTKVYGYTYESDD